MKHYFLSILILILTMSSNAWAQTNRIEEIRSLYASALDGVKEQQADGAMPVAKLQKSITRIEPAIGSVKYEYELYLMTNEQNCAFYRYKRTAGPYPPTVTEALYDSSGKVMFCFTTERFYEDDVDWILEERFYWNANGTLNKVLRKARKLDGSDYSQKANSHNTKPEEVRKECEDFYKKNAGDLIAD